MEEVPVLKVIEIHRRARIATGIIQAVEAENRQTSRIVMFVAVNERVVFVDRAGVNERSLLPANPRFELHVVGQRVHEFFEGADINSQAAERRLIKTVAHRWIGGVEPIGALRKVFEPEPRQMLGTKWPRRAG